MRILVLGGTVFLSAEMVRAAVARGHDVTALARGSAGPPPAGAHFVRADRRAGTAAYAEVAGPWDAVLEVSWQPRQVRQALALLAQRTAHWTYISSCSVYADHTLPGGTEDAPLLAPYAGPQAADDDGAQPVAAESYGAAKVACERLTAALASGPVHIVRPGLIAGPGDPSGRFGYWPARLARGGPPVLLPALGQAPTQTIDVRDLAGFVVRSAEDALAGVHNAVGPTVGFEELIGLTAEAAGYRGSFVRAEPDWLAAQGVEYWAGPESLPHWLPEGHGGFATRSHAAATAAGLRLRPPAETIAAVLADELRRGVDRARRAGLSPAREAGLLAAWAGARP